MCVDGLNFTTQQCFNHRDWVKTEYPYLCSLPREGKSKFLSDSDSLFTAFRPQACTNVHICIKVSNKNANSIIYNFNIPTTSDQYSIHKMAGSRFKLCCGIRILPQCGGVTRYGVITPGQHASPWMGMVIVRRLFGAKTFPKPMLTYC